ncbi:MAG TPA: hypothetical protein VF791_02500 [Pyrinomonadaceae bacterium]
MRNKFFFGVVVGFFIAVVAFVVFLFFSGTVRAAVDTGSQRATVSEITVVGSADDVGAEVVGVRGVVVRGQVVSDSVVDVPNEVAVVHV